MRKIITRKRILILCLFFVVVVIAFLFFSKRDKSNNPREVAVQFLKYVYEEDIDGVRSLMSENLRTRTLEDTKENFGLETDEEAVAKQGEDLAQYIQNLKSSFGDDLTVSCEVQNVTFYSSEELKETNMILYMMDVDDHLGKAAKVTVQVSVSSVNGTEGSTVVVVPVYRSGGVWSLGQYIGSAIPDSDDFSYDWFGDLMDGTIVTGMFDENGNEVYYDEEGYEMTEQEDGSWIGYDEFGNIRYYDENKELVNVTGPDGGDVFTE